MYRIVEVPQYYQDKGICNRKTERFLRDTETGQIIEFETREEAAAEAKKRYTSNFAEDGIYHLAPNEHSPMQYEVFNVEEHANDPDCIDASNEKFHGYDLIPVEDVPEDVINAFNADDGVALEGHDIVSMLFTLKKTGNDGRDYIVAYRVRILAIDAVKELSDLNWTNESYYRSV